MELSNKIDFSVIICVSNANPNGDPLNGNRPRTNYDGFGEISDVCIKRKIRNKLLEKGKLIFVQSDDYRAPGDEYRSLHQRAEGELTANINNKDNREEVSDEACKKWLDVRAFGIVMAFKDHKGKRNEQPEKDGDSDSVSIGIRGPVSIHPAFSITPVDISSIQISKSVSNEGNGAKKGSDTLGMKHRVDHGVYVFHGSINPQLASKTGFGDEDAEDIKSALVDLFQNDASSARPEGSIEVYKVYWWKHNCRNGQYSSARVHRALEISLKSNVLEPKCIEDYIIKVNEFSDLKPEVIDG